MICMIVFCLCAIMQIIISSFKIAIDHINDSDLEELQKGDPAKAGCLERYHSDDHLLVISSSFLRIFSGIGIVASSFTCFTMDCRTLQKIHGKGSYLQFLCMWSLSYYMRFSFLELFIVSVPKSIVRSHCAIWEPMRPCEKFFDL